MDNLFEQFTAISKAGAYDAILPKYQEMQETIVRLESENAQLKIMLKGEQDRVQALKDFINDTRPENSYTMALGEVDKEIEEELSRSNPDDLKDIDI